MWVVQSLSRVQLLRPMNCSPPGSSVHGISQARILEWVAFPSPVDPPNLGMEPESPALQTDSLLGSHQGSPMWIYWALSVFKALSNAEHDLNRRYCSDKTLGEKAINVGVDGCGSWENTPFIPHQPHEGLLSILQPSPDKTYSLSAMRLHYPQIPSTHINWPPKDGWGLPVSPAPTHLIRPQHRGHG